MWEEPKAFNLSVSFQWKSAGNKAVASGSARNHPIAIPHLGGYRQG
jgi:hypothetical protein